MVSPGLDSPALLLRLFYAWRDVGLLETMKRLPVMSPRGIEGPEASSGADAPSTVSRLETTESGSFCGYNASKNIKGRKRCILSGTCRFLIFILAHAADIQEPYGAVNVLAAMRRRLPWLREVFADWVMPATNHALPLSDREAARAR